MPEYIDSTLVNKQLAGSTTLIDLSAETNKKILIFQANFCSNGTVDQMSIHKISVSGTVTSTLQVLSTTPFSTNTQLAPANLLNMTLDAASNDQLIAVSTGTNLIDAVLSGKTIVG